MSMSTGPGRPERAMAKASRTTSANWSGSLTRIVALGDGDGDTGNVHLLKGVLADEAFHHITGDKDHRRGVVVGCGNAGGQIGCARPGGGEGTRTSLCRWSGHIRRRSGRRPAHERSECGEYLCSVSVRFHLIIDVQDRTARIAEYRIHALLQQALIRFGKFHSHRSGASFILVYIRKTASS